MREHITAALLAMIAVFGAAYAQSRSTLGYTAATALEKGLAPLPVPTPTHDLFQLYEQVRRQAEQARPIGAATMIGPPIERRARPYDR